MTAMNMNIRGGSNPGCLLIYLAAALFALWTAPCASAQVIAPWVPGFEHPFRSSVYPKLVDALVEQVRLSDAQRRAVQRLQEEHRARFDTFAKAGEKLRSELDAAITDAENGHVKVAAIIEREEQLAKLADEQAALDERFFTSIEPLLAEEQLPAWEMFRYRVVRTRWLARAGGFPEAEVDLIDLLETIAVDHELERTRELSTEPEAFTLLMTEYARDIDRAVRAVAEFRIKQNRTLDRSRNLQTDGERVWSGGMPIGSPEHREWLRERRRGVDLQRNIRDITRQYRDLFVGILDEQFVAAFGDAFFTRAAQRWMNPERFQAPPLLQSLDRMEATPLSDEQRSAITSLVNTHDLTVQQVRREIIAGIDASIESRADPDLTQAASEAIDAKIYAAIERRNELDRQLVRDIWPILTPAQQEAIPRPSALPTLQADDDDVEA